jgi:hypothetical protein
MIERARSGVLPARLLTLAFGRFSDTAVGQPAAAPSPAHS